MKMMGMRRGVISMTSSRTLKYKKGHMASAFQIQSSGSLNPGWWAGYVKSGGVSPHPFKVCGGPEHLPSTEHLRKSWYLRSLGPFEGLGLYSVLASPTGIVSQERKAQIKLIKNYDAPITRQGLGARVMGEESGRFQG